MAFSLTLIFLQSCLQTTPTPGKDGRLCPIVGCIFHHQNEASSFSNTSQGCIPRAGHTYLPIPSRFSGQHCTYLFLNSVLKLRIFSLYDFVPFVLLFQYPACINSLTRVKVRCFMAPILRLYIGVIRRKCESLFYLYIFVCG